MKSRYYFYPRRKSIIPSYAVNLDETLKMLQSHIQQYEPLFEQWYYSGQSILTGDDFYTIQIHQRNDFKKITGTLNSFYSRAGYLATVCEKLEADLENYKRYIIVTFQFEIIRIVKKQQSEVLGRAISVIAEYEDQSYFDPDILSPNILASLVLQYEVKIVYRRGIIKSLCNTPISNMQISDVLKKILASFGAPTVALLFNRYDVQTLIKPNYFKNVIRFHVANRSAFPIHEKFLNYKT